MKKILFATVALAVLGGAAALIYGDMPIKTYYPNGVLKSETQRSFFKKNGYHKEYHPNGQLQLEATYVNGIKNGEEKQYLDNGTLRRKVTYLNGIKNGTETVYYDKSRIEIPYEKGKKEGKANIIVSNIEHYSITYKNNILDGPIEGIEDMTITAFADGKFSAHVSDGGVLMDGRLLCQDDKLYEVFFINDDIDRMVAALRCLSIEQIKGGDDTVTVKWDGAFNFPRFTKTTSITVTDLQHKAKNFTVPSDLIGEEAFNVLQTHYTPNKVVLTISDDNQTVSLNVPNKQDKDIFKGSIQFDDIASLIETGVQVSKDNDFEKLFPVLKNTSLNELLFLTPHGTKDLSLQGKIQPALLKVSDETNLTLYNPDEKPILEFKAAQNGIQIDVRYPQSAKPMLSVTEEINIPHLSKLQESLAKAETTKDYMVIGMTYGQDPTLSMPQEIILKDFKLIGADGTILAQSEKINVRPNDRYIAGNITVSGQNNQKYKITFVNPDTASITEENGKVHTIRLEQLATVLQQIGYDKVLKEKLLQPILNEGQQLIKEDRYSFITLFFVGFFEGMKASDSSMEDISFSDDNVSDLIEMSDSDQLTDDESFAFPQE